jgi:hypothetical protein
MIDIHWQPFRRRVNPDRRFVIADPDPLVRAVHPLDVLPREAKR